jgi:preprotein translocase subunit YajC
MRSDYTGALLYTVLVVAAFYFLWFRPQQRQRKALAEVLAALTPGDEVMTASGMIGKVVRVADDVVHLEIAEGVVARFAKGAIVSRRLPGGDTTDV